MEWLQNNWLELVAALYALECILAFISRLTPWKWDDNIAGALGSLLRRFFPKGQ